jgi:hypothetical protein
MLVRAWAHHDITDSLFGVSLSNGNNNGAIIGGGQVGSIANSTTSL